MRRRGDREAVEEDGDLSRRRAAQRHGAESPEPAVLLDAHPDRLAQHLGQRLERAPRGAGRELADRSGGQPPARLRGHPRAVDPDFGEHDHRVGAVAHGDGVDRGGGEQQRDQAQDDHGVARALDRKAPLWKRDGAEAARRPTADDALSRSVTGYWLPGRFPDSGRAGRPGASRECRVAGRASGRRVSPSRSHDQWRMRPAAPITVAGPWGIRTPFPITLDGHPEDVGGTMRQGGASRQEDSGGRRGGTVGGHRSRRPRHRAARLPRLNIRWPVRSAAGRSRRAARRSRPRP